MKLKEVSMNKISHQDDIKDIISLRNQLLVVALRGIIHDPTNNTIIIPKKGFAILLSDWKGTTKQWERRLIEWGGKDE